ncbi:Thioredoxin reductase [Paenibacillus sp. UNCCL117]|uniref:NAD(P)/FAD-dependent oxidoreductase n=1 Tax=unclassified Paenibacillus TaxID=185978 RepID=UPI0008890DB5|nr:MULTISPECIES: NAD(P)/FAD-dependent oxidoreductase [unclassified Paenibacillus]SDC03809.1 Thioredoxin reductase [Paenibacillus sp. cl123]SFW37171.1 Thioredoxin reductase [Paenibacillus sp. UNCCL117]
MYDCLIVGGGFAGLQAAIQLGRYRYSVLVVDKGRGRSTLCGNYRNIIGWPDGVSGDRLRSLGRAQAESYGVHFIQDEVIGAARHGEGFELALGSSGGSCRGRTLLIATGISDRYPAIPRLEEKLGHSVFVCPDCDGYETAGKRTLVLGSGTAGAGMALTLRHWCEDLVYVNHERQAIGSAQLDELQAQGIAYIEMEIAEVLDGSEERLAAAEAHGGAGEQGESSERDGKVLPVASSFGGVLLKDGTVLRGSRGFIAFGGNQVHSDWAVHLGVERMENRHIVTDPRTKRTHVPGVWAAGDIGVHAEQSVIAMGEGAQAAIWMHKELSRRRKQSSDY